MPNECSSSCDAFESGLTPTAGRHVHGGGDSHLTSALNPPHGQDRIAREQYATTTIRPGAPNERRPGMETGKGSAIPSEQFKTVNHHNFG